jgi:cytochrome P450
MFNASRYPWFTAGGGSPHSIFETNAHDLHRLRRGALNPFFSKRSIVSVEPIIHDKVSRLCALFRQQLLSQRPVELRQAFSSLTLDIISNYCFGESWNCLENDKLAKEWKTTLDEVFEKASLIMHFPWIIAAMNSLPDSIAGPIIRHYRVSLT